MDRFIVARVSYAVLIEQTSEVAAHRAVGYLVVPQSIPPLYHHHYHLGEAKFVLPNSDILRCPH
jgi:hypothetical protein